MQSRSIRRTGQTPRARAMVNAGFWPGPDPRRAIWPAGMGTASTGRTHGCTDQACDVKISLANPEPSTHGTFRKCRLQRRTSAFGAKADLVNSMIGAEWGLLLVRGMMDMECPAHRSSADLPG